MDEEKSKILHLESREQFEKLIKANKPVLVDFFAEWCGPCQMMGPILDELSDSYKKIDEVEIAKLDIDKLREVALEYEVMSVPTFIIFKEGKPADIMVGMRSPDELSEKLDEALS